MMESIFVSDTSGNVNVYDIDTGTFLKMYKSPPVTRNCMALLNNEYLLASAGGPTISAWVINSETKLKGVRMICPGHITAFCVHPRAQYIAVALGGDLTLWQRSNGRLLGKVEGHFQKITIVIWSKDGEKIISGGEDGVICVWTLSDIMDSNVACSGRKASFVFTDHRLAITDLAVTILGNGRLFSVSLDKTFKIFSLDTGSPLLSLTLPNVGTTVALDAFEHAVFVGTSAGSIKIIYFNDSTPASWGFDKRAFEGHTESIKGLQASYRGSVLVSASIDKTVKVWNIRSFQCLRTIKVIGSVINLLVTKKPLQLQFRTFRSNMELVSFVSTTLNDHEQQLSKYRPSKPIEESIMYPTSPVDFFTAFDYIVPYNSEVKKSPNLFQNNIFSKYLINGEIPSDTDEESD